MASIYLIDAVDSATAQTRTFHIGNFTLPRVTISGYVTLASLLSSYPDLSTDVTLICGDGAYTKAIDLGFTDVVKARDLLGKTFTLRNGNTISITASGSSYFDLKMINPSQGITYMSINSPLADMYAFTLPSYGMCASDNSYSYAQFDLYYRGKIFPTTGMPHIGGYVGQFPPYNNALTPADPYTPGGISGPGGGTGGYDFSSSDDIDFPGDPGVSAVNTGFISLWAPTEQQMLNLSRYMWNVDITTIDFWKRLWADPMDIIYGLNIIPVDFRATGRTIIGGTEHVIVGLVNTKVDMDYLVSQWIDVDCGTINIDEAWGAYLDYDPYTKLEIYLPYCGYHPLRIDDFMSGSISLKYKIDLLSGACIAMVKATKPNDDEHDLDSIVYQFMGNCATQIPVTASQFADAVRSTMSLAASIGTMVATGVGGAAAAASKQGLSTVGKAQLASSMIGEGAAAVENVMGIKPAIERSGAVGGAAGLLAVQIPYLILTRPRQAHPEEQNKYTGFPSFMTRTLGDCSGWTMVKEIHLDNIPCTSEEMIEIDNLLKEGVIM